MLSKDVKYFRDEACQIELEESEFRNHYKKWLDHCITADREVWWVPPHPESRRVMDTPSVPSCSRSATLVMLTSPDHRGRTVRTQFIFSERQPSAASDNFSVFHKVTIKNQVRARVVAAFSGCQYPWLTRAVPCAMSSPGLQVYKREDNVQIVRDNKSPKMIGTIERFEVDEPNLADNESGDASKSFVVVRPIGGNNVSRQPIQCNNLCPRARPPPPCLPVRPARRRPACPCDPPAG